YRLIFLLAAEDRGLLHPPAENGRDAGARRLYAQGYSLARLRERSLRHAGRDRHHDLHEGLKLVFRALATGEHRLALPALGGLFAPGETPNLDACRLGNAALLDAVFRLAWLRQDRGLARVNWRDMETEELGSVYESLLELTPRREAGGRRLTFASGAEGRGHARKTTGSYYTPDALVRVLLDATLDPVLDRAEAGAEDKAGALLSLSVLDPAAGSGHFLLAAGRRIAARVARHRAGGVPSAADYRHALREVVSRCLYGVDRNPLAVELCKVALWIEALEPGKPLTFLDAHVRCGDSLIGVFDYEMLSKGIPDEAYKPLTGDDKDTAKAYGRHNKQQRAGKGATGFLAELKPPAGLIDAARALAGMPEDTLAEIAAKRTAFARLHAGRNWLNLKIASDCYVAAFFAGKTGGRPGPAELARPVLPLTDHVWAAARGQPVYGPLVAVADGIAHAVRAFHWPLEFPHVFARGGFDAAIGNPPWEVLQLGEQEYFAARSPDIAAMPGDARKKAIARLRDDNRRLWDEFVRDRRAYDAANEFFRASGRFDLTAVGKINTYALFAEHFARLARPEGRSGVIVPTGIATDSSTAAFFGDLVTRKRLTQLIDFENRKGLFPAVDSRMKFCILAMGAAERAGFAFFLTDAGQLDEAERRFTLSAAQIRRINPNTRTAPVFRSRADAALTASIYERVPVLIEERPADQGGDLNPWGITFQQGLFNMTSASEHFRTEAQLLDEGWTREGTDWVREADGAVERRVPLYEAKMIHHFDHRWATYAGGRGEDEDSARDCTLAEKRNPAFEPDPRYWVPEREVGLRAARVPASLKRALREANAERCLKALAEWLTGYVAAQQGRAAQADDLTGMLGRGHAWRTHLGMPLERFLREPRTIAHGAEMQRETPLTAEDVRFLRDGPEEPLALAAALVARKQPRWLMGWRDITNATNERTVIAAVMPRVGVGHTMPLFYLRAEAEMASVALALWTSLPLDFIARLSIGGTHLTYSYLKQLPVLPPSAFTATDLAYITPRVLELTYTSHAMRPWARDLGHAGPPFAWDETRRAELRAELDAFFARKYGLTREELRYILDPADIKGTDYPSETFRVLKTNEIRAYGEYRTQRLVLAAWDRQTGG
ncbi:MAG: type II DNA modification enzyme, partial [Betaproteobacteria bacterium]|nr:type II DNA modification enzyme [Betaproteobacteria bacterium]